MKHNEAQLNWQHSLIRQHDNKVIEGVGHHRFIITGRNIDVTDGLRSAVEEKLGKLDRFLHQRQKSM